MSPLWFLGSLLLPAAGAAAAGLLASGTTLRAPTTIWLNAVLPGTGLAAQRRPLLEVVLGVLMAQASLVVVGSLGGQLGFYLPTMVVGGVWAWLHTEISPFASDIGRRPVTLSKPSPRPGPPGPATASVRTPVTPAPSAAADTEDGPEEHGFAVEVRCTECGAGIDVPVLHRAAVCGFCGSDHLVIGHDDTLFVTIPLKITDQHGLREAILDHFRYRHYLTLYERAVAPLERQATEASPSGVLVTRPETAAAAAAAEAAVSRKADAYRAKLATSLALRDELFFLAPYRHGVGTMVQATFGRSHHDQEKQLRFAVATLEASQLATTGVELPAMGKLSYLRALRPAATLPENVRGLDLDVVPESFAAAYGDLDRKQLVRDLQVIRVGSHFRQEVVAVVWRPWWIVTVGGGIPEERLLVDAAAGSVVGTAPFLDPGTLGPLPAEARAAGQGLRFTPMECPTCGHEFPFDCDAVLQFCVNCHRVFEVDDDGKREVPYAYDAREGLDDHDLVPFWRFPLALDTSDGRRISDMWHLKDGIDGTLDQIGRDAPEHQHAVYLPAIRCINSRLMAAAFVSLFRATVRQPPTLADGRFPLDVRPQPWTVDVDEPLARDMLPLYLVSVFERRDIARVNVHQVESWLFKARQVRPGTLTFVRVPRPVTEPFRRYAGRSTATAVRSARGEG